MAKCRYFSDDSPTVTKHVYDPSNIVALLESVFAEAALIDASFDGLLESKSTDSDQNEFIERALHLGSVLLEAGKRSVRKRSSIHNESVWPLPPDLTSKVFSMLGTRSVCCAASTCSFFQKCAIDPLCYINFTGLDPKVTYAVVSTMIERSGNRLQSIKLGMLLSKSKYTIGQKKLCIYESSPLTSSCLSSLSLNAGATGDVGVADTVEAVSRNCRLLERFIYEGYIDQGRYNTLETSACEEFVLNCPKITTLALKGCQLDDCNAGRLVTEFHKLKYVDFTDTGGVTGTFLKNVGTKGGGNSLEVMILRDCRDLDKVNVEHFMKDLLAGKFRLLRHLDIWNCRGGLKYNGDYRDRRCVSSILIEQLLEQRPNFCLIPHFPEPELSSHTS